LLVRRENDRVRLLTMNGHDWSDRYPWMVETAREIRQKHFVIDVRVTLPPMG
jgi:ATP-dependent DNA ligase